MNERPIERAAFDQRVHRERPLARVQMTPWLLFIVMLALAAASRSLIALHGAHPLFVARAES